MNKIPPRPPAPRLRCHKCKNGVWILFVREPQPDAPWVVEMTCNACGARVDLFIERLRTTQIELGIEEVGGG